MRVIRLLAAPALAAAVLFSSLTPAAAKLLIAIDKASQTMSVSQDGSRLYNWPVSTGVRRYDTPAGSYTPFRMEKDHFSKEWDDAPMPNSIFFTKRGHAIHGTNHTSLGRPASHGCVRLSVEHSRVLFDLVRRVGMANTKVVLGGEIPAAEPAVARAPRTIEPQPRRLPPRSLQPPAYPQQPGYPPADEEAGGYGAAPAPAFGNQERRGYWLYPDGRRVYVDRDPRLAPLPPEPQPFLFGRGPGWQ
jgi:hypothetical protein